MSLGPDPENQIKAYRGISIALFSQKKFDEAKIYLNLAIGIDPSIGDLYLKRGIATMLSSVSNGVGGNPCDDLIKAKRLQGSIPSKIDEYIQRFCY